jgi:RNA polymerase sigma-70 factor (family 1)
MSHSLLNTDKELMHEIAHGNAHAFQLFFSMYKDKVYAYSLSITHSVYYAEEITQEVFLKAWLNRNAMPELESPEAWIITVTKNLCFNQLKKSAREKCIEILKPGQQEALVVSIEKRIEQRDLLAKVQKASLLLTPKEQLVYRLNKEQGLKKDEIAKELNISHHTVKVHLANALRKIRHLLENYSAAGALLICFFKKIF